MEESKCNKPDKIDAFLMGLIPMILFGLCVFPPAGMAAMAVVFGPLFIWKIARWLNHRDDPHNARRPSEPP